MGCGGIDVLCMGVPPYWVYGETAAMHMLQSGVPRGEVLRRGRLGRLSPEVRSCRRWSGWVEVRACCVGVV
jgi:hypothetical protein